MVITHVLLRVLRDRLHPHFGPANRAAQLVWWCSDSVWSVRLARIVARLRGATVTAASRGEGNYVHF
jgi:hypothetical protein